MSDIGADFNGSLDLETKKRILKDIMDTLVRRSTAWRAPTVRSSATRAWRPLGSKIFRGASSGDPTASRPKRSEGAKSRSGDHNAVPTVRAVPPVAR
jgi:hypothetical protein